MLREVPNLKTSLLSFPGVCDNLKVGSLLAPYKTVSTNFNSLCRTGDLRRESPRQRAARQESHPSEDHQAVGRAGDPEDRSECTSVARASPLPGPL